MWCAILLAQEFSASHLQRLQMVVEESYCSLLRQILGDTVTKGSVYVLFDEGSKSKWVRHLVWHPASYRYMEVLKISCRMHVRKAWKRSHSRIYDTPWLQACMVRCEHIPYLYQFRFCCHAAQRMYTSMWLAELYIIEVRPRDINTLLRKPGIPQALHFRCPCHCLCLFVMLVLRSWYGAGTAQRVERTSAALPLLQWQDNSINDTCDCRAPCSLHHGTPATGYNSPSHKELESNLDDRLFIPSYDGFAELLECAWHAFSFSLDCRHLYSCRLNMT